MCKIKTTDNKKVLMGQRSSRIKGVIHLAIYPYIQNSLSESPSKTEMNVFAPIIITAAIGGRCHLNANICDFGAFKLTTGPFFFFGRTMGVSVG